MIFGNPIRKAPSKDALRRALQSGARVTIHWRNSRGVWTRSALYVKGINKFGRRVQGHGMLNLFERTVQVKFDIGERNSFMYFIP